MPHHRVYFVQAGGAVLKYVHRNAQRFGEFRLFFGMGGHKFVQRRVHQAHRHAVAGHGLHRGFDFLLHIREEFFHRGFAFGFVAGKNHFAQDEKRLVGIFAVEHMFNAEQPDAFGPEFAGFDGVVFRIGVGAYFKGAHFVAQGQEGRQVFVAFAGFQHFQSAFVHVAFRAVQGQFVAFFKGFAAHFDSFGV